MSSHRFSSLKQCKWDFSYEWNLKFNQKVAHYYHAILPLLPQWACLDSLGVTLVLRVQSSLLGMTDEKSSLAACIAISTTVKTTGRDDTSR